MFLYDLQHNPGGYNICVFELELQRTTELLAVLWRHLCFSCSDEIIIDDGLQGLDILIQSSIAFPSILTRKNNQGIAFAKEQQEKDAVDAVIDQIETMKKAVLARTFRGEPGTNDPANCNTCSTSAKCNKSESK